MRFLFEEIEFGRKASETFWRFSPGPLIFMIFLLKLLCEYGVQ